MNGATRGVPHGRVLGWSAQTQLSWPLDSGWQLASSEPTAALGPDAIEGLDWQDIARLEPVAAALSGRGQVWCGDAAEARVLDGRDWWYRLRWCVTPEQARLAADSALELHLEGLATLAQVWLDGQSVLQSSNMFRAHRLSLAACQQEGAWHEIVLVCRSLDQALSPRRARPRWRVPMLEQQQLRWMRTSLLGRTPGWSPPWPVVGPWRAMRLAARSWATVTQAHVDAQVVLDAQPALGSDQVAHLAQLDQSGGVPGRIQVNLELEIDPRRALQHAEIRLLDAQQVCLARAGLTQRASSAQASGESGEGGEGEAAQFQALSLQGSLQAQGLRLWWPHTHGQAQRYGLQLVLTAGDGEQQLHELGPIGLRVIELSHAGGDFCLRINGVEVFCRGVCWTPLDAMRLDAPHPQAYDQALQTLRQAGMNMVRVCGPMAYEQGHFWDSCDRLGIMVWQDYMFANMDYPEDESFVAGVREEVRQQAQLWQGRPSLTIVCGNSEQEQQAAMFGAPRALWSPKLFHEVLAQLTQLHLPGVPYWPSSAHGGAFPHQNDVGTTSYYGVGAYMREINDARVSGLRFASECLAFAQVPERSNMAAMPGAGEGLRVHHAAWKARVPRDLGAGWDFDDVRDHYLARCFGVDALQLRYSDHEEYLTRSRIVTGEVMAQAFGQWRAKGSRCHGALVWWARDLWPGAGWGLVDSQGKPKAVLHVLARVLQPLAVWLSDEGSNGIYIHVANDTDQAFVGSLQFKAWRDGCVQVAQAQRELSLQARECQVMPLMDLLDGFGDWSWAYRFGPPPAQVLSVGLRDARGELRSQAHCFPAGWNLPVERDLGLKASCTLVDARSFDLVLSSASFAQWVQVELDGFEVQDQYFHLDPGQSLRLRCTDKRTKRTSLPPHGQIKALNGKQSLGFGVEDWPSSSAVDPAQVSPDASS